jgi:hypothetical protein
MPSPPLICVVSDFRLSTILPGLSGIFRQVPSITPRATIGAKFLWRVGSCDLVCGRRESFTLGCVLPFSAHRTF